MGTRNNYSIKIDDMLLHLLKEYHQIDASEALTFFSERVVDMKELNPNITNNSRRPNMKFSGLDNRTVQSKFGMCDYQDGDKAKFYVLRGFYPDSNIPFKLVVVYSNANSSPQHPFADAPKSDVVLHVKVIMGMKPHWTIFNNDDVDKYKDHVSESILLDQPVQEENKLKYKYRQFKCMRPKGMKLYRERNYDEKQLEKKRVGAAKRRKAKKDAE